MRKKTKNKTKVLRSGKILSPRKKEVFGLSLIVVGITMICSIILTSPQNSNVHIFGIVGTWMSQYPYEWLGYTSALFSTILVIVGYILFTKKNFKDYSKIITQIFLSAFWLSTFSGCLMFLEIINKIGNLIGHAIFWSFEDIFGLSLSILILAISFLFILTWILNISNYELLKNIGINIKSIFSKIRGSFKKKDKIIESEPIINLEAEDTRPPADLEIRNILNNEVEEKSQKTDNTNVDDATGKEESILEQDNNSDKDISDNEKVDESSEEDIVIEDEKKVEEGNLDSERKNLYFNYKLPSIEDLANPEELIEHDKEYLENNANDIVHAMQSFGVSCKVVKISPGPVITLYEVEPAEGVRLNKIKNISEDLSRLMGGKRVRVIDNIPGTRSIGIELPNDSPAIVYLKNIINSNTFINNKSKLKIALGKTTTGEAYVFNLEKMPHLLVAGATGAGKSVCINTIIVSILYNAKPDEVKFILMDPKKVELSTYKSLVGYHLITAKNIDEYVMTTAQNSVSILESAINEMEKRFQLFSEVRVRNIGEYHQKQENNPELEIVPYIVVIIDELADLMMTSGRAIEEPITRLAQKARAVGIHLIVATQRPSVDVITGLIKSNFPARISFQVSSKIDSRTIIDQIGAEKLLGRGDMLFLLPGSASPIRLHNAFITLPEIEKIMNHISSQPKPEEIKLPEIDKNKQENGTEFNLDDNQDELLKEAAKLVVDYNQASVSLLQRKFRIGYSRAGRLIDELESLGIVSPYNGSKAREVLVGHNYLEDVFGK